tara:strand:+ start:73 stop:732 length:660 start_codon:yes stop_codon:yes gene_type:complete
MRDIKINNKEVLDTLNWYSDWLVPKYNSGQMKEDLPINCMDHTRDRWIADDYLQRQIAKGRKHEGFPESMRSFAGTMPNKEGETSKSSVEYREKGQEVNQRLMTALSAKKNTLVTCYPPGGWISWHNNANASGYNVLFSWSETGDGWFDYWDLEKKERVRIPDVQGWQCKMGYFGGYDQPERVCWHAASTECLRISVAYVFAEAEGLHQDIIDDIEENW